MPFDVPRTGNSLGGVEGRGHIAPLSPPEVRRTPGHIHLIGQQGARGSQVRHHVPDVF
jgi:hypothetical protein